MLKKHFDKLLSKAISNLVSVKCTVFVISCIFLWHQKISQDIWVQVILIVVGARTANEITSLIKNKGGSNES